ncbi:hypothetical protein MNBD_GAMMA22-2114 [hydrothermal vent metagenome]|uniref:Uncharacterized protein n=1 Tax=hydrothermal vent metagenome TaxID=652676 RepID=A0A3B1A362_9ZZZZ
MLASLKQLVLFAVINFISVYLLFYLLSSPPESLSENKMSELVYRIENLIKESQALSSENPLEIKFDTSLKRSSSVRETQSYPTLIEIKNIIQAELKKIELHVNNPQQPQQHSAVKTNTIKDAQYQQSLNDSNVILSKVLNNQKLTNEERSQWGLDHSRLNVEDQKIIIDKIVTAINNQELHLEQALDLPF